MTYPFQSDGTWHDGEHEEKELVVLPYVAEKVAFRNIINYFFPARDLIFIDTEEYNRLSDEEKSQWTEQDGLLYKIKDSVNEKLLQRICKKLGMVANGNFLLLKHFINAGKNEFVFYSMYSNLAGIDLKAFESTEKMGNEKISYIDKRSAGDLVLFPNTYLAQPDTVYEKEGMKKYYQVDYFVTLDTAKGMFKDNKFLLSGNECCRIKGNHEMYKEKKQDVDFQHRYFLKDTYFEILDYPDERRYINTAKIRAYLVPATIHKEIEMNEETDNLDLSRFTIESLNLFHYRDAVKIGDLRKNNLISKRQERYAYKHKFIRCETVNGKTFDKNAFISSIEIPSDKIPSSEFLSKKVLSYILLHNIRENILTEEFFVELDVSIFKEVYVHKKRMLKLRKDSNVKCYKSNPALVEMEKQEQQKKINLAIKKCDVNCLNTEHIKTDGKNFYYKVEDDLYIKLPENFSECHADLCTDFFLLEKSDLEGIEDKEKGSDDKHEGLKKVIEEKFGEKNIKAESCLIEHPSEWGGKEQKLKHKIFGSLYKEIQIWNSTNKNGSLPKEIQDSSNFCYFYADAFEEFLRKLHRSYADTLRCVQDTVMRKWMYKQGNSGLYPSNYNDDGQTCCNHAVYETIKQVDGEYLKFLMDVNEPAWAVAKYKSKKDFFSFLNERKSLEDGNYKYRPSNLWCDVLEYQAEYSNSTGIHRITAEQAFYMARLGYVVIAAWKNLTPNGNNSKVNYSPHFVTVRPTEKEYQGIKLLKVAHVGAGDNKELVLVKAYSGKGNKEDKYKEVCFYCNIRQCFI